MPQLLCHLFGDYVLQSDWMAQNKTKAHWPAFVHALLYSLLFLPLCWHQSHSGWYRFGDGPWAWYYTPSRFAWLAWLVIFGTHFLIGRYRLARYVVWAKNWIAPYSRTLWEQRMSWKACEHTGYVPEDRGGPPSWMAVWLLIIADNACHLLINYLALRYL